MLQENWCKEYSATAGVLINVGEAGLRALYKLEDSGVKLSGGFLRSCFEGVVVQEDQHEIFQQFEKFKGKVNKATLQDICAAVKEDRMWKWLILHPGLNSDYVHPSRSVF